jgi:O-acetyl-ADP-ribose deacetylase (regulator of RNase III)
VIPAVGNGQGGYSPLDCANAIVDAMIDVSLIKKSSLSKIVICLNDEETYKVFEMKLKQS